MNKSIIFLGDEEIHLIEGKVILSEKDKNECREFARAELIFKHMKEFSKILEKKMKERIRYKRELFQKNIKIISR